MKQLFTIIFSLSSIYFFAQKRTPLKPIGFSQVNIFEQEDTWQVNLQSKEMPNPEGNSEKDQLLKLKNELALKYGRKKHTKHSKSSSDSLAQELLIESGFDGNPYNNKVPNDNTLAISNEGIIVSGINSRFIFYNTNNDSLIGSGSIQTFTFGFPQ